MKIVKLPHDHSYSDELYDVLDEYNAKFGANTSEQENFLFALKDENGKTLGGAQGRIFGDWLILYSMYSTREIKGVGSKLLAYVENYAKEKNCKGIHLTTFEFQAPGFYKKNGYEVFAEFENYISGYTDHYMRKVFKD